MAWNGSGTFSRTNGYNTGATTWVQDRNAAVKITAARHDTHDQDLAAGINACLTKNGENSPTTNLPMGGFKHTNVAQASARTEYARVDQVQDGGFLWGGTSGGTANAQTISLTPAVTSQTAGRIITFIPGNTNTGATTLAVNGLAAVNVKFMGWDCVGGELVSGVPAQVLYTGSIFILLNHGGGVASYAPTASSAITSTMTLGSHAIAYFFYQRFGLSMWFTTSFSCTTGGSASDEIMISLPISARASITQEMYGHVRQGSTDIAGRAIVSSSDVTKLRLKLGDDGVYSISGSPATTLYAQGWILLATS